MPGQRAGLGLLGLEDFVRLRLNSFSGGWGWAEVLPQSLHLGDFLFLQEHILASVSVGLSRHRPQSTSSFSSCLPCFCFADYLAFSLWISLNISLGLSPLSLFCLSPSPLSAFLSVSLFPGPHSNDWLSRQILESLNLTLDVEVLSFSWSQEHPGLHSISPALKMFPAR